MDELAAIGSSASVVPEVGAPQPASTTSRSAAAADPALGPLRDERTGDKSDLRFSPWLRAVLSEYYRQF